jgi:aerobic carbon-monoxide dehydrogenase small subunit
MLAHHAKFAEFLSRMPGLSLTERFDITLNINGLDYEVAAEARRTLVDVIRDDCGLTGTHVGCEHGVCGACTIILDGEKS